MGRRIQPLAITASVFALLACGDDGGTPAAGSSSTGDSGASDTVDPSTSGLTSSSGTESLDDTGTDTTSGEEPTREEEILQDLTTVLYECPERVWPGDAPDNYRGRQVLLVSVEQDQAWLWNDQVADTGEPPRVSTGPASSLPLEWTASTFNFGMLNGVRTVSISLDVTAEFNDPELGFYGDYGSVLAFHEGFHFLSDQDDWNAPGGSRLSPYPEPWEPRYLRAELLAALRESLEDATPLGDAAFWHQRMEAEFPEELAQFRSLEIREGSAEYVTIISAVLAELGCDATDEALHDEAVANLDSGFLNYSYGAGGEPYDIGLVAGMLLRAAGEVGWEDLIEGGSTPLDLVLGETAPVEQPDDPELQATVQAVVDARNVATGKQIEPMLEALASDAYVRVVGSFAWVSGSFQLGGFYYLPEVEGEPEVYLNLTTVLDPPSGVLIELDAETSLIGTATPCALAAGNTVVMTIPVEDVAVADGLATSTGSTVMFDGLAVEETTDVDGLTWLCPVDAGGASPLVGGPVEAGERPVPHHVERQPDGLLRARMR